MSRSFNTVDTLPVVFAGASISNVSGPPPLAGTGATMMLPVTPSTAIGPSVGSPLPLSVNKSPFLLLMEYSSGVPPWVEVSTTSWTELSPVITMLLATLLKVSMDTLTMPVSICRASKDSKRKFFERRFERRFFFFLGLIPQNIGAVSC